MTVRDLSETLSAIARLTGDDRFSGDNRKADLFSIVNLLRQFGDLTVSQFAEFLTDAAEFRKTGKVRLRLSADSLEKNSDDAIQLVRQFGEVLCETPPSDPLAKELEKTAEKMLKKYFTVPTLKRLSKQWVGKESKSGPDNIRNILDHWRKVADYEAESTGRSK